MGHIIQDQNGDYDFGGHDIDFVPNPYKDNKIQQIYLETILGIIPPEELAEFEIKEVDGKNRVFVNGFLYKNYSNFAEDILRENVKTAVSMETEILQYSYSVINNIYNILNFEYTGITFLGKNKTPAMKGANAQFYEEQKAKNIREQMSIVLQDLKSVFSLEDNNKNQNEGGTQIMENNREATPVVDIPVADTSVTDTSENTLTASVDNSTNAENGNTDNVPAGNTALPEVNTSNTEVSETETNKTFSKTFEISHEDIRYGLYQILAVTEAADNKCYWIEEVYDNYFDYSGYEDKNKCYRQYYTVSNNEITLTGERIEMFIEKLTSSELTTLNAMRSTYEAQTAELNELRTFKSNYELANKTALVEKWEDKIGNYPEFAELKTNYTEKSIDEIEVTCKCIFADNNAFTEVQAPATTYAKTKANEFTPVTIPVHEEAVTDDKPAEIDNGNIVHIGDYDTNEREVRKVTVPTADSKIKNIGLVVTPELIYDESVRHGLEDYVNPAGSEILIMRFHDNDIFSVTAEALDGTPAKDKFVDIGTTTKMKIANAETAATIGKIVEKEITGQDTYYVVQVTM